MILLSVGNNNNKVREEFAGNASVKDSGGTGNILMLGYVEVGVVINSGDAGNMLAHERGQGISLLEIL